MLWMAVTADIYELPIAVENTASLLARRMGTTKDNIICRKHRKNNGARAGYRVVAIEENLMEVENG